MPWCRTCATPTTRPGNITHIQDDAQQTIYFSNRRVEPSADYTYDALYRLIEATGREHLGQTGGDPTRRLPLDNDASAWACRTPATATHGHTTWNYVYDAVGNFLEMHHRGSDPAHPGWTRTLCLRRDQPDRTRQAKQPADAAPRSAGPRRPTAPPSVRLRRARQHAAHAASADHAVGLPRPTADDPAPAVNADDADGVRTRRAHLVRLRRRRSARAQGHRAPERHAQEGADLSRRLRDLPRVRRHGANADPGT